MAFPAGYNLFRLQGDLIWAGAELAAKFLSDPLIHMLARRGDGTMPVMTLPGFSATESTLDFLHIFLKQCGYVPSTWGMGMNNGISGMEELESIAGKLVARVKELADRHGRPVALVGQSLGGIFARELARRSPAEIDRVITLGTPTIMSEMPVSMTEAAAHILTGFHAHAFRNFLEGRRKGFDLSEPPPGVTLISIYSRYDGVVSPQAARIPERYLGDRSGTVRENVELVCSHYGMAMNPLVLLTIADRLAEDKGDWAPFDPLCYAGVH